MAIMVEKYTYKGRHRQNRLGNVSLGLGIFVASFLTARAATAMQHAQVKPVSSLKPDSAGNMRTDDIQGLAANTFEYLGEQTSRGIMLLGSFAMIALIGGIAFTKRAHDRTKQAEQAERKAAPTSRAAYLKELVATVNEMGKQTDAIIAWSKTVAFADFPNRALEIEASRPKDLLSMSNQELITLAQTNQALPVREEPYYSPWTYDTKPDPARPPMSRTVYRSLARLKEFHDDSIVQDSGYHPLPNAEQRGVHDLMPDLLAAPPAAADPYATAAYPQVAPQPA